MTTDHLHPDALSALLDIRVDHQRTTRSAVASAAGVTPGHLHDLVTGRRSGTDPALRSRLALTLGVKPAAITCRCASAASHRPQAEEAA